MHIADIRRNYSAVLLIIILNFLILSCTHQKDEETRQLSIKTENFLIPVPADVTLLHSADVQSADNADGDTAYVFVRDSKKLSGHIQERISAQLTRHGFTLTDQPSKADRIIEVEIVARGRTSQAEAESCVRGGYGSGDTLGHGDQGAVVADILLVRRRAHTTGSQAALKNISSRNAMSSSKLRIGAVSKADELKGQALEQALASDIAGIAASDTDMHRHKTRSSTAVRSSSRPSQKSQAVASRSSRNKSHSSHSRRSRHSRRHR